MASLLVENRDGDTWVECRGCGRCNWLSRGAISHARTCESRAQHVPTPARPAAVLDREIRQHLRESIATPTAVASTAVPASARRMVLTDCYDLRGDLKDLDAAWDPGRKAWILTEAQFSALRALVDESRTRTGNKHAARVRAYDRCGERWESVGTPDPSDEELRRFARDVRRTGTTLGRDDDVREAIRRGHLSESDAMNADD